MTTPTEEHIHRCVLILTELIPFTPQSEPAQEFIEQELMKFVATTEALAWLESTCLATQKRWLGVSELRGLYCAGGFSPLDGVWADSETPGFTPDELRQRQNEASAKREQQETITHLDRMKQEAGPIPRLKRIHEMNAAELSQTQDRMSGLPKAEPYRALALARWDRWYKTGAFLPVPRLDNCRPGKETV